MNIGRQLLFEDLIEEVSNSYIPDKLGFRLYDDPRSPGTPLPADMYLSPHQIEEVLERTLYPEYEVRYKLAYDRSWVTGSTILIAANLTETIAKQLADLRNSTDDLQFPSLSRPIAGGRRRGMQRVLPAPDEIKDVAIQLASSVNYLISLENNKTLSHDHYIKLYKRLHEALAGEDTREIAELGARLAVDPDHEPDTTTNN